MKPFIKCVMLAVMLTGSAAWSQQQQETGKTTAGRPAFGVRKFIHGPAKWWRDADTVRKIGLTDGQAQQIEQIFMEHRMKLIDWVADLQKQELKLESALNADQPDEGLVSTQVDQVVAARGKLEKENALMMLNIRRQLTPDQWKKLQSIRGDMAAGGVFFHRFVGPAPMPPPDGDFTIAVPPPQQAPSPQME
jgi:Spy/CpxP family protein refolding chaperone